MADYRYIDDINVMFTIVDDELTIHDADTVTVTLPTDPAEVLRFVNAVLDATGTNIGAVDHGTGRVTRIDKGE